jgi:anti-sigma B factor antagonist
VSSPLGIWILDRTVPAVVALRGELTAVNAPRLRTALFPLAERDNPDILVDLTEVSVVDAVGLSVLAAAGGRARGRAGRAVLVNPTSSVSHVMELAGLADLIWNRSAEPVGLGP